MGRPYITEFTAANGSLRPLRKPDARATAKQLLLLNRLGLLDVTVHPYQFEPISQGEAAAVLSDADSRGYLRPD